MNINNSPLRISGACGLLFVVLSFIASGINVLPPAYNQDAAMLADWFALNSQWYRGGHFMAGIAFLLFYFPFYAGLCEKLRLAEGTPAVWSRVTWAGAILSPAVGTIAGAFINGLTLPGEEAAAEVASFGMAAHFYAYSVSGAFGGVAMTGAAVVILSSGVFPKWIGWIGLLTGLSAVISTGFLFEGNPAGFFASLNGIAWLVYFLWIAALSVEMIRKPECNVTTGRKQIPIEEEKLISPA